MWQRASEDETAAQVGDVVRRELLEAQAKLSIVAAHEDCADSPCDTLRAVAAVYPDHPDYRAEWMLVYALNEREEGSTLPSGKRVLGAAQHAVVRRVRSEMARAGMNQMALAHAWGVPKTTLSKLLSCTTMLDVEQAAAIAAVFGLQFWELSAPDVGQRSRRRHGDVAAAEAATLCEARRLVSVLQTSRTVDGSSVSWWPILGRSRR